MTDWLQQQHQRRCGDKKGFPTAELADKQAENASRKTGQLIISYQCFDCGLWHIGHADRTQRTARKLEPNIVCTECGSPISGNRLLDIQCSNVTLTTCSPRCSRRAARRRQRARRRARSTQSPPVSEGDIPSPS